MNIYLDTVEMGSLTGRVVREWNSGQELDDAIQRLTTRYNADPAAIRTVWAQLERQYGVASVTWSPAAKARQAARARQYPEYCNWKGWSGPGRQLREIVAAQRSA